MDLYVSALFLLSDLIKYTIFLIKGDFILLSAHVQSTNYIVNTVCRDYFSEMPCFQLQQNICLTTVYLKGSNTKIYLQFKRKT